MKLPGYPKCDGTNTGRLGLFRRMAPHPQARFAAIHVVPDRDDEGPAAAGANVLGPVVSIMPLSMEERVDFAELANTPRARQSKEEEARENAMWLRLPRLTCPGIDLDPKKVTLPDGSKVKAEGSRDVTQAHARKVLAAAEEMGFGLRPAWSSGADGSGGIHLDWLFAEDLAEIELIGAMKRLVKRICEQAGVPTSENKTEADLSWVDLIPFNYAPGNRGGLWRPLGGLHKSMVLRKELIGWPQTSGLLTGLAIDADLREVAGERSDVQERSQRKRSRPSPLTAVAPIRPIRQSQLGELRAFIAEHRANDGGERHSQRMAWAATLLLDGIADRDVEWILAKAVGNVRATSRIVDRTRDLIESGSEGHPGPPRNYLGRSYLEKHLGLAPMVRYGEILSLIQVKDTERDDRTRVREAAGGLRALTRSLGGLSRGVKEALKGYAEVLRIKDATDPAIGGLLRPSICRSIHEKVSCSCCKGSKGCQRLACEDELCSHCHGTRVLHEHDVALAAWLAEGAAVEKLLVMHLEGHETPGELETWVREMQFGAYGTPVLKIRTLRYFEPTGAQIEAASAAGDLPPVGRIRFGVIIVVRELGSERAFIGGGVSASNIQDGLEGTINVFTAAGAAEQVARARWATHVALRTAAAAGEVEELARVYRLRFRRRVASRSAGALHWPGRTEVRESISEEVAKRREEREAVVEAAYAARGEKPPQHGEEGYRCEGCPPSIAHSEHHLMSSGRDDAEVVNTQRWRHTLVRAHTILREWERRAISRRDDERHSEVLEARWHAEQAAAARLRAESLETVPF